MTQLKGKGKGIGGYLEGVSEEREPVESEIKIMYIRERVARINIHSITYFTPLFEYLY